MHTHKFFLNYIFERGIQSLAMLKKVNILFCRFLSMNHGSYFVLIYFNSPFFKKTKTNLINKQLCQIIITTTLLPQKNVTKTKIKYNISVAKLLLYL